MKPLILLIILVLVSGCAVAPSAQATIKPSPIQAITALPTTLPTLVPTPTPAPTALPTPTPDPNVQYVDLTAFVSAWNSHDSAKIRSLYWDEARYFTEPEMQKLKKEEPFKALVSEDAFLAEIQKYDGLTMRVLGTPIGIINKLIAFTYRWENADKSGYNAAALLRYEGDKILIHVDMVSAELTPAETSSLAYLSPASLDDLMKAWTENDLALGKQIYSEDPMILSDEDLAQASWRDFIHPPQLKNVLTEFKNWKPSVLTPPVRLGDLVIFAFRWNLVGITYPASFGVRVLHYKDSLIATDIRYGIRPWEKDGKEFMTP